MPITRTETDYRDLDLDFFAHPVTKDIPKKTGVDAIKRSIRNIVLMQFHEAPFQPWKGCGVHQLLFMNNTDPTAALIAETVEQAIRNFEPRAELLEIAVSTIEGNPPAVVPSFYQDLNSMQVEIKFRALNSVEPQTVTIFLERIR